MVFPFAKLEKAVATWAAVIEEVAVKVSPAMVIELPDTIAEKVTVDDSCVGWPPSTFEADSEDGGVVEIARSATFPGVEAVKTILFPDETAEEAQPDKVPLYEPFAVPGPVDAPDANEAKADAT